jgi:hypothetical protein
MDNLTRRGNYEVKGLLLGVEAGKALNDPRLVSGKTVPEDAAAVVIAGPTIPLSDATIDALKKYMREPHKEKDPVTEKERQRKGKLMVLADVVPDERDRMKPLNLDKLLAEYEVDVSNERVLRITDDHFPERVLVTANPDLRGRNPLATLFAGKGIYMNDVRVVRAAKAPGRPGEAPHYQATELLVTAHPVSTGTLVMGETDLRPPRQMMEYYQKHENELEQKARVQLPVGVSVAEPGEPDMSDPHAFMGGGSTQGTPRVEVIGDASFVSDESLGGRGQGALINYELFASALAWLREKPSQMGLEAKDRGSYTMQQNANFVTMMVFPFGLMSLSILGLGLGVWVVRRR